MIYALFIVKYDSEITTVGDRVELSIMRQVVLVRDLGSIMIISNLSQFSLRILVSIQDLMSVKQMERAE